MTQLHETRMGQALITHTLPELVRQLERLNQNLERLADLHVRAGPDPEPQPKENDREQDVRPQDP
jgi:hypothetical protein